MTGTQAVAKQHFFMSYLLSLTFPNAKRNIACTHVVTFLFHIDTLSGYKLFGNSTWIVKNFFLLRIFNFSVFCSIVNMYYNSGTWVIKIKTYNLIPICLQYIMYNQMNNIFSLLVNFMNFFSISSRINFKSILKDNFEMNFRFCQEKKDYYRFFLPFWSLKNKK